MTRTAKILLAALAVTGLTGAVAFAGNGWRHMGQDGMGPGGLARFEQADADKNGEVSAEEFASAFSLRLGAADSNNDGVYAVEEIAAEIERQRALMMAQKMIDRMDIDNDGKLSRSEVDTHKQQLFARLDGNNDGKITKDELPRHGMQGGRHGHGGGGGMRHWR